MAAAPLFAMMAGGYCMVKFSLIEKSSVKGLVSVVFWLFLPFFIFIKIISAKFIGALDWTVLLAYYLPCAVVFALAAIGGAALWGGNSKVACLRGLAAISGVVGYMGLPLLITLLGDSATVPAIMITMADNLVILAGGSLLMELTSGQGGRKNRLRMVFSILKNIACNPLLLAVVFSMIYLYIDIPLPDPVLFFAHQMTNATGPLALVALGAALATHSAIGLRQKEPLLLALLKIIVLPALVFISCKYLFSLNQLLVQVAVLMAGLPIAVNVYVLASRYKEYEAQSSYAMSLSAGLSLFSLSCLIIFFNQSAG